MMGGWMDWKGCRQHILEAYEAMTSVTVKKSIDSTYYPLFEQKPENN